MEGGVHDALRVLVINVLTDALVQSIPDRDPSSSVKWSDDRNQLE